MARMDLNARIGIHNTGNAYAVDERARKGMRPEAKRLLVLCVAAVLLVLAAMLAPTFIIEHSLVELRLSTFLDRVSRNLYGLVGVFTGNGEYFEERFMSVLCCAVSGAALGLCGATYQGAFNNPLAAPKTLGVMSGGALGSLIWILCLRQYIPTIPTTSETYTEVQRAAWMSSLSPGEWFLANYGQALCSVAGCLLVVAIVMALTTALGRGRGLTNVTVIVFGQLFSGVVTSVISFCRNNAIGAGDLDTADLLKSIENYFMIQQYCYEDLIIIVLPLVICMIVVLAMRGRLTLISFGDEEAAAMGVNVNRTRYVMIAVCTFMTGWAISFCGHIAFLGFISGHIARRIVGPDFRYLLPASMAVGCGFITIIQWVCQSGLPGTSLGSAGVACSIIGACVFLGIVLSQRGRGGSGDWR